MTNENPMTIEQVERSFRARKARKPGSITRTQRYFVHGGNEPPVVHTRVEPIRRGKEGVDYEIVIETKGVDVRERARPQMMRGQGLRPNDMRFDEAELERLLEGYIPDHLDFNPKPQKRVKPFRTILPKIPRDRNVATTLFGTDDRMVFQDTNYPWSTVGLVETNRGSGSGVVIGPRHLLTVSHVIDWTAPAGFAADWVRFTPSYFDGDAPFGESYGVHIYWYVKEDGDGFISGTETDFDYVVVVLDHRIGESTGWMGARHYNDDWDSLNVWSHMGYPGDLNSGQRPIFISPFKLDGTDDDAQDMLHKADVFPGQSGGPMFAWWDGDVGPRAVAVQSYQNASNNGASGGRSLRNLVAQARTDFA